MKKRSKPKPKLYATAYHEAGHAVTAHLLSYAPKTKSLTIVPHEDSAGHRLSFPMPSLNPEVENDLKTRARLESRIVVLLAGAEAERKYTGRYNINGANQDYVMAEDHAFRLNSNMKCVNAHLEYFRQKARHFVISKWNLVKVLAAALIEHRTLSGKRVKAILNRELQLNDREIDWGKVHIEYITSSVPGSQYVKRKRTASPKRK